MPLVVHFKKPSDWRASVNIHYWDTTPAIPPTAWPGAAMTAEGDDWFSYSFETAETASLVFNDGAGRQTANLRRDQMGWYYRNSQWYDANPERPAVPVITVSPPAQTYLTPQQVVLQGSNRTDVIHYTTDGATPTASSPIYAGPIEIARPTTLMAFGINSAGDVGGISTFRYTIDPNADLERPTIGASVASGTHETPVSVVFTVRDNRPAPVVAYFTTDGSAPTPASPVYARGDATTGLTGNAIAVASSATIRFLAIDGAGNETRQSFYYNIGPASAPGDFREETIYFLITTRFYDGDPNNNYFCRDRIKFNAATGQAEDPHWRGDFRGLIQQLDYLRDLGFTAIWITPPVENRSGLDYHGYHAYDWTRIDPRLESPDATYQDLINAAHARGIKIVQDVVINHSSQYGIRDQVWVDHLPIKYYVPRGSQPGRVNNGPYQGNLGDYRNPNREDNDNPLAPAWFRERQRSDPAGAQPLVDPRTSATVPSPGYDPNRFFGVDANTLNPEWYHQQGFMAGGDWESVAIQTKHLAGDCLDLATERQNVKDYLINAVNRYLDMGVDALRIDTVKHLARENLLEYVNAWKAHKPGLFVFGENLVKGTGWGDLGGDNAPSDLRPWWYTRLGNDRRDPNSGGDSGFAVLDFSLFSTFRDNLSRGGYGGIGGILGMDWVYGDATQLVTFLQNHDVGPDNDFRFRFRGEQWMAAAAYNLLWTIRGIPCLYYGEEIEFMKGAPQDIIGNDDTLDSTGRAYFGDHLSEQAIAVTQSHPLYQHIKRLNLIRRAIPALQKAPMSQVSEWGGGMSFVRDYNNGESYAVVGLAMGGDQDITVGNIRNGAYADAVTGNRITVSGGNIAFHVRGNSAGIYVLNGPGRIGEDGVYLR
ncbi:MAG: chitobiase/beta-hexosaminidase C-terminal domain-containing protein [Candidatus Competibacteraceae bacterium]|nr:chitobiase/beta-hexosaminidase C-terminal domain-containing protein [Candidatus Competibacteraceae bacterium]